MMNLLRSVYRRYVLPRVCEMFFIQLIRTTGNFRTIRWLGVPAWQNILDLWVIQEVIADIKPGLLIECGTHRGGAALFYAHLFDLLGKGEVLTIDVEKIHELTHPRITFVLGSSTSAHVLDRVRSKVSQTKGAVLVILDSDHSEQHVYNELTHYSALVTPGSYCLVQDGVIDRLRIFKGTRPGPLPAIMRFLKEHDDFIVREDLSNRFLITHHPKGWLQRKRDG